MVVGICRLALAIPGNASLKGKRSVVRRVVERARNKYNVAIAEVDDMDVHQRATIGFAVVSNDARHANSMIDTIVAFVSGISEARLTDRQMEIVHFGELGGGRTDDVLGDYDDEREDDDVGP